MAKHIKCKKCNEYHWNDENCLPKYRVYHDDYLDDEGQLIGGNSHYDAAIRYAQYYDQDECTITNGGLIEVKVERNGISKTFNVNAEVTVVFNAEEVELNELPKAEDLPF